MSTAPTLKIQMTEGYDVVLHSMVLQLSDRIFYL